jgi:O-acetylserine/cysteine efflux transporter
MTRRDFLLANAVAVVWGINFVFIHIGLESFPPLLFAALRFTLTAFPAVLFIKRPAVPFRWVVAVGLTLSAGQFAFLFTGIHLGMPAGLASVALQLQVVFSIGLAVVFLGERPGRRRLFGAVVALLGMAILAVGRAESVPLIGVLLIVAAAASWAVGNICVRMTQAPDPIPLVVWSSLIGPLPLFALSLALEGPGAIAVAASGFALSGVVALAYIVIVSTFFGYGVWTSLLQRYPASRVVPFSLLVPVVGIAAAWIALGERPTVSELVGAVVILGGLALATGASLRRRSAPVAVAAG